MTDFELKKTIAIYKKTLEVTADNGETCFRELDKNTLLFLEELEQYRAIGTIEDFKALKEKNEPKKVVMADSIIFKCPQCGSADIFDYCGRCGCKIDFS